MSDSPAEDQADPRDQDQSDLDEAAQEGELPYVEEENEAAERGEDQSDTVDPDEKAEETGRGDIPGGINMH